MNISISSSNITTPQNQQTQADVKKRAITECMERIQTSPTKESIEKLQDDLNLSSKSDTLRILRPC